jgi:hypothetical protein
LTAPLGCCLRSWPHAPTWSLGGTAPSCSPKAMRRNK